MRSDFENHLPRRLRFGRGISGQLAFELQRLECSSPLIVFDSGVGATGIPARLSRALQEAGLRPVEFAKVEPEPPFSCVNEAATLARSAGEVDAVVAVGGGSVMDTAKLVAAVVRDGRDPVALAGIGKVGRRAIPLVCIPTTAGTGSEATPVAIFTDPATSLKVGVVDPCLIPDVVLLDPELTDGLPALPTAAAGMDALVHALEAFIARSSTPIARGLALEAARRLGPALPAVCANGNDRGARDAMLIGANLAGLAFANSSCCAVHALALPLGGRFHLPHGVTTGCLAAATMRHNLPACSADIEQFAAALGIQNPAAREFPEYLEHLADSIGLRRVFLGARVPESALPELAAAAVANRRLMDPNPRPVGEADALAIYRSTFGLDA